LVVPALEDGAIGEASSPIDRARLGSDVEGDDRSRRPIAGRPLIVEPGVDTVD
jgi:hypothetical protein